MRYIRESTISLNLQTIFRPSHYSTASIGERLYIFGGYLDEERISEYNDDQWRNYGSLLKGRFSHSSITVNSKTIILGAFTDSDPRNE